MGVVERGAGGRALLLHETFCAEFLHGVAFVVILGASGSFAGFGGAQFFDDIVDGRCVAFSGIADGPAAEGAEAATDAVWAGAGEIHLGDGDSLSLDVEPDVAFGPIEECLDADVFAWGAGCCELVPELWGLVFVVPFEVFVARGEVAFLGAGGVFVAADAGDESVPFVFCHYLLEGSGFEFVGDGDWVCGVVADGAASGVFAGACAGVLVDFNDEVEVVVGHGPVSVREHFWELVCGVDVQEGVGDMPAERLFGEPDEDVGIFAHAPGHADIFEVMKGFADEEDALGFESIEVDGIFVGDFLGEEGGAGTGGRCGVLATVGGVA